MTVICKTRGIALRSAPVSETSRVVTWLTPDHGRVATLLKGAQRPKSPFLGQVDLYYTCELLFYPRLREALPIARECTPLKTRDRFREDWRATAAASYFADLAYRVSPPGAPHPEFFVLLEATLDDLAAEGVTPAVVHWFELKLLHALGLAPRLQHCARCGRDLAPGQGALRFAPARGGLLCGTCKEEETGDQLPISADIVAPLAAWQRSRSPRSARSTQCSVRQQADIERFLGRFLAYHLDTALPSRLIALEIISRQPGIATAPRGRSPARGSSADTGQTVSRRNRPGFDRRNSP